MRELMPEVAPASKAGLMTETKEISTAEPDTSNTYPKVEGGIPSQNFIKDIKNNPTTPLPKPNIPIEENSVKMPQYLTPFGNWNWDAVSDRAPKKSAQNKDEYKNFELNFDVTPSVEEIEKGAKEIKTPYTIRKNDVVLDGETSPSTVKMATETFDGKNWVSFPTLFPKDPNNQTSDKKDWMYITDPKEAYDEAVKRGEVWEFGEDKESALKFGEGSWKVKSEAEQVFEAELPEITVRPRKEGEEETDYDRTLMDLIENSKGFMERGLVKAGMYVPEERKVKITEEVPEVDENATDTIPFTQFIKEENDTHWRSQLVSKENPLSVHRNQFRGEEGFVYKPVPAIGNKKAPKEIEGSAVAHFFIKDGRPDWVKDIWDSTNADLKKESDYFKTKANYSGYKSLKDSDYVPVTSKTEDNGVKMQYKKKSEVTPEDNVILNLTQYKYKDIDWNSSKQSTDQFDKGIKVLTDTNGKEINATPHIRKDSYSRYSGTGVVYLFEVNGNTIVRDFAGSINEVKLEAERIADQYKINPESVTLGFFDSGSFSAKPKGKDGKLNRDIWDDYNTKGFAGSGIAIP